MQAWPLKLAALSTAVALVMLIVSVILLVQPAYFADELIFLGLPYRIALTALSALAFGISLVMLHRRTTPAVFRSGALLVLITYGTAAWIFHADALHRRNALKLFYYLDQKSRTDSGQIGIIGRSNLPTLDLDPLFAFVRIRGGELTDPERVFPQTIVGTKSEWKLHAEVVKKLGYQHEEDFSLGWTTYSIYGIPTKASGNHGIVRPNLVADAMHFLIFADSGNPNKHLYDIIAHALDRDAQAPYAALFLLGDNIYLNAVPMVQVAFDAAISRPLAPFVERRIPIYALLGNHDYNSPLIYSQQLKDPMLNMNGFNYYDVTFGDNLVTFFLLDTERLDTDLLQTYWLRRRLKESDSRWKILLMHVPAEASDVGHGGDSGIRHVLEAADVPKRIHLVLTGHNHIYERRRGAGRVLYITCGGTGSVSDYDLPEDPKRMVGYTEQNFFTELDVTRKELRIRATNESGKLIDDVTVVDQGDWQDTPGSRHEAEGVILSK